MNACVFSQSFALGRALIKAEGDRKRLNERDAPVFQLLDKHVVHTVSSNITITVWLQDNNGQRQSTDTKKGILNGLSEGEQHKSQANV